VSHPARPGELLWQPSDERQSATNIAEFRDFLNSQGHGPFHEYGPLWKWSVDHLDAFWASVWSFFRVQSMTPYSRVTDGSGMPGTRWFDGARLNFAEHLVRHATPKTPAILHASEHRAVEEVSWSSLIEQAGAVARALVEAGVGPGDRVVSTLPNVPEAIIAFIATVSLGAVWSGASPEMGRTALRDRFAQIEPAFLFVPDGYQFSGTTYDRRDVASALQGDLPTLRGAIVVSRLGQGRTLETSSCRLWEDVTREPGALTFAQVPFEHPLWIVYTSGTTGPPKAIVHSHGGILLERLKAAGLHLDVKPGDVFFWYTTTAWIMWNIVTSTLANGATIVLYDGSPQFRGASTLWRIAEETRASLFGAGAGYLEGCMRDGFHPGRIHDLGIVRTVGSTAAPLSADAFRWVYKSVKSDVMLASSSGGTDVATAFVGSCPLLPVYAGEIQCRCLGVDARALDEQGNEVLDRLGELVIAKPMPSMPLYFWGDVDGERYADAYFRKYPGLWCHGDAIRFSPSGSATIAGRSDSTLNRHGVRVGTSEIYRVVEGIDAIQDSLVVDVSRPGGSSLIELFVVLGTGIHFDDVLKQRIRNEVRVELSPRHVPDEITAVDAIPRSLNGKKLEVPVKRIMSGEPVEQVVEAGAVANLSALLAFHDLFQSRRA
jgi:acetoacetyl-CoA synthetase